MGQGSMTSQLELFSKAAMIIAPHGAGLTNIMVSPLHTPVLEIGPPACPSCYLHLTLKVRDSGYILTSASTGALPGRCRYQPGNHGGLSLCWLGVDGARPQINGYETGCVYFPGRVEGSFSCHHTKMVGKGRLIRVGYRIAVIPSKTPTAMVDANVKMITGATPLSTVS